MIEDAIEWWMGNKWTAMPATVVAYDFDNQCVDVTPDIDAIDQEGNTYKRPTIAAVPVVFPCSPTSAITFPLPVGAKVLLVWGMRSIDNWKQNGVGTPSDYRMFDIRDAFAFPAPYPRNQTKTRAGQSKDDLVLVHNIGGTQCEIHLKSSGDILAKTPSTFKVECSDFIVNSSSTTINASTASINATTSVNGTATISGKTTMSDGFDSGAASTVTGGIGIDGIQFGNHKHPYFADGESRITGDPQ